MRALLVLALMTAPALAQPPGATGPIEPRPIRVKQKDPALATVLALAGTVTPVVLIGVAATGPSEHAGKTVMIAGATAVLLPSAGHWYAGKFFTTGMAIRAVGAGAAAIAIATIAGTDGDSVSLGPLIPLGAITVLVGAGWDIGTAGTAVEARNHRVYVAPINDGYSVGLAGTF